VRIWIDADAAPRDVKDLVFRASKRLALPVVLVANQRLQPPPGHPLVSFVWVPDGADVADQHIAEHAVQGDLEVTQDIPLAALLVPKGVARIDGVVTGGPAPYDARAKQKFAAALDRVLTRLGRRA
jgi:uncharacterized protein YaiI (UPF0178 family)